jgi:hypothetical protein
MNKFNIARIALLFAVTVMFLGAIGCGSSGDSSAGQNISPTKPPKGQKAGGKRNASAFISTS